MLKKIMVIIPNYSVKQVYKLEIWIGIISHHNSQLFSSVFLSFYVTLFLVFLFFVLHFFFLTLISMLQDLYFLYVVILMNQMYTR